MRCPRCQRDSKDGSVFCPGCGAPLALRAERAPAPLDVPVPLDRRTSRAALTTTLDDLTPPPPPRAAPPARAPEPASDRSSWDLGAALGAGPERTFAPGALLDLGAAGPGPGGAVGVAAAEPAFVAAPAAPLAREPEFTMGAAGPPAAPLRAARDEALPDADVDVVEVHLRRAAPWRRAASWAVDGLPFLALLGWAARALRPGADGAGGWDAIVAALGDVAISVPLGAGVGILAAVYLTLCHALAGATLGKRLLGLAVVGPDGRRPSVGRAAARTGLATLSIALLGLGSLLALFTASGRALHDLLARTWVVEAP